MAHSKAAREADDNTLLDSTYGDSSSAGVEGTPPLPGGGVTPQAAQGCSRCTRWCVWLCSPVIVMIYVHFLLNLQVSGMTELYPLFATRAPTREAAMGGEEDNGGLGMTAPEVGRSLTPIGFTLFITPLLYPILERRVGHVGCLSIGACRTLTLTLSHILARTLLLSLSSHSQSETCLSLSPLPCSSQA